MDTHLFYWIMVGIGIRCMFGWYNVLFVVAWLANMTLLLWLTSDESDSKLLLTRRILVMARPAKPSCWKYNPEGGIWEVRYLLNIQAYSNWYHQFVTTFSLTITWNWVVFFHNQSGIGRKAFPEGDRILRPQNSRSELVDGMNSRTFLNYIIN